MISLKGKITESGGEIFLKVYDENDNTYLGKIKMARKPSKSAIKWAENKIENLR